jgi:hypothetical protein
MNVSARVPESVYGIALKAMVLRDMWVRVPPRALRTVGHTTVQVAIATSARNGYGPVDAVRCLECGATRWTMFGTKIEHLLDEPCEVCGGKTVVERRRPGTGAARPFMERRDREESRQERV